LLVTLPGLARDRLDRVPGRALQLAISLNGQALGPCNQVGHGVDAEDEPHFRPVPAVEVPGLAELRVTPEGDLLEPRAAAEGSGLVEVDVGVLVRAPVAAAI